MVHSALWGHLARLVRAGCGYAIFFRFVLQHVTHSTPRWSVLACSENVLTLVAILTMLDSSVSGPRFLHGNLFGHVSGHPSRNSKAIHLWLFSVHHGWGDLQFGNIEEDTFCGRERLTYRQLETSSGLGDLQIDNPPISAGHERRVSWPYHPSHPFVPTLLASLSGAAAEVPYNSSR